MATSAMVVVGSLLGDKVVIKPKQNDDWTVVPNLWGMVVGRPSAKKTPALKEACGAIRAFDDESKECFEQAMIEHSASFEFHKVELKEAGRKSSSFLKNGDRGEALDAIRAVMDSTPEPPTRRRRLANDTTIEKLGELLNQNPHGLMVFRDELTGWLRSLDREDRGQDRAFYLEGWSGLSGFTFDRIGRGTITVPKLIVSVLGGIQPEKLKAYLLSRQRGEGDDGLLERFQLTVYPDNPEPKLIDQAPDEYARSVAFDTFRSVDDLAPGLSLHFASDAQEEFNRWYQENLDKCHTCDDIHVESLLGKYPSLVASLALIIHVCESGTESPVSLSAVTRAAGWAEYLESHARRINGMINNPTIRAQQLASHLKDLDNPFTPREVRNKNWHGLMLQEAIESAIAHLIESGHLKKVADDNTGGRPSVKYFVNPKVL